MGKIKDMLEQDFTTFDLDYENEKSKAEANKEPACFKCVYSQSKKSKKPCWRCDKMNNYTPFQ